MGICCVPYQNLNTERRPDHTPTPQKKNVINLWALELKYRVFINKSIIMSKCADLIKRKRHVQYGINMFPETYVASPSRYLWTISMSTSRPSSWALSIRDFRSSGVPQRLLGAKKLVTWYLHQRNKKVEVHL